MLTLTVGFDIIYVCSSYYTIVKYGNWIPQSNPVTFPVYQGWKWVTHVDLLPFWPTKQTGCDLHIYPHAEVFFLQVM